MKPGVMAPSQMPRRKRTAKRAPKEVHAAWQQRTTAQRKMLMLGGVSVGETDGMRSTSSTCRRGSAGGRDFVGIGRGGS